MLSLHLLTKLFHQLLHGCLPPPSEALLQNAPQHHPILAQDGVASLHLEQGINLKSWAGTKQLPEWAGRTCRPSACLSCRLQQDLGQSEPPAFLPGMQIFAHDLKDSPPTHTIPPFNCSLLNIKQVH